MYVATITFPSGPTFALEGTLRLVRGWGRFYAGYGAVTFYNRVF